jgi:hypothetical protein
MKIDYNKEITIGIVSGVGVILINEIWQSLKNNNQEVNI